MGIINDVYEVTVNQEYSTELLSNVFNYKQIGSTGDAVELATKFLADVWPSVQVLQADDLLTTTIDVKNLFDPVDFFTITDGNTGPNVSELLPEFSTFTYALFPASRVVRPGRKAFAGVTEVQQDDGVIVNAGTLANLETLRSILIAVLKDVATNLIDTYAPVIVKRIREGVAPDITYRLPETQAESVTSDIVNTDFQRLISSQVSRKRPR